MGDNRKVTLEDRPSLRLRMLTRMRGRIKGEPQGVPDARASGGSCSDG